MKYTERVAEYEFVSKIDYPDILIRNKKYKLKVEGRKYESQYRTVKCEIPGLRPLLAGPQHRGPLLGAKTYFVSFPSMIFSKNTMDNHHFYTVFGYANSLQILGIPNISFGTLFGAVCLGEKSHNSFYTTNDLSLNEFIDEFWLTKFSNYDFSKKIPMYDICGDLSFPNLWFEKISNYVGEFT